MRVPATRLPALDELHPRGRGDVLEDHPQVRLPIKERPEDGLEEDPLPIEDVDVVGGDLPVGQQGRPRRAISASTGSTFSMAVTPWSELVVAPAR